MAAATQGTVSDCHVVRFLSLTGLRPPSNRMRSHGWVSAWGDSEDVLVRSVLVCVLGKL